MRATPTDLSLQQCWFLGYHSDIGSGRMDNALSVFPLIWMMSKLNLFLDIDVTNIWPINRQRILDIVDSIPQADGDGDADTDANANAHADADSDTDIRAAPSTVLPMRRRDLLWDMDVRLQDFFESLIFNDLLELWFKQERNARGFKNEWHAFSIEEASKRSPVEKIKDSMAGVFKAGGSWPRTLCRDLYSDKGPFQMGSLEGGTEQETIHWSVRSSMNCGATVKKEPPLKGAEFEHHIRCVQFSYHVPCTWNFKDKEKWWKPWKFEKETWWKVWQYKRERPSRSMQEKDFPSIERHLLAHWFCYALTTLEQEAAKDLASQLPYHSSFAPFIFTLLVGLSPSDLRYHRWT